MRRAGAGLIVAVLALAGCKSTDPKPGDDKAPGGAVGRFRKDKDKDKDGVTGKAPTWLDPVAKLPGAGTGIPKGSGTNPKDPNFDAKIAAQEYLGGRVLDPNGKPARNIIVRVEEVGAPPGPIETAVYTNNDGYFQSPGKPGKTYELTAEASLDGHKLVGVVQTKVPNPTLLIMLRDDLAAGGAFPPPPKPSDKVGDQLPPASAPKAPVDGAWTPGGPVSGVPPATIGGSNPPRAPKPSAGGGQLPPPDDSIFPPSTRPTKPENVADGPKDPLKAPPASIPGPGGAPPVPPLPTLPPAFNPPGGGRSSMDAAPPGKLMLVDTLERPWSLDSVRSGTLVLMEFMDTSSEPCREYLPILKDLQSRYGASGLQLAGVVCDNVPQKDRAAVAAKYSRDNNLNYALYVEPGPAGGVRDRFKVERYPHAVLLDSTGKLLWSGHPGDRAALEAAVKQNLGR